jgi:hypothetical protein
VCYTGSTYYTGSLSIFHPVISKISYFLILLRMHTCNRMSFCLTYHCLTDLCCNHSARVFDFGSDDDDAPLFGGNACQYLYFFTSNASKLPSKLSTIPSGAEGARAGAAAGGRRGAAEPQGAGGSERVALLNLFRRCYPHVYLL